MPGSSLAAFVTFREMQADYSGKINDKVDFQKMQTAWVERLAKFVLSYPKAEDTPEALMQLGMVSEFINQEIQAKNAYASMARDFATHALAPKAKGALRRLECEGKVLELAGPTRNGAAYDINQSRGKMVVVYYWASWNQQCVGDFARLKVLLDTYGPKGLELVCVNLDNSPPEADSLISRMPIPGIQVMQTGGLDSPLATAYGIMSLPNLFLVDKDGKVQSRTIQVGGLDDEMKKQLK
jgi:thiol-disulfide isomerase/thioredoxin